MRISEWNWKVNIPCNRIGDFDSDNKKETWLNGTVVTKYGIVDVYSQGGKNITKVTTLGIVHNGIMRTRSIYKKYSAKYLVTLANRYAEEIFKEANNE